MPQPTADLSLTLYLRLAALCRQFIYAKKRCSEISRNPALVLPNFIHMLVSPPLETDAVPRSLKLFLAVCASAGKGSPADPANYRPISFTFMLCKVLERALNNRVLAYQTMISSVIGSTNSDEGVPRGIFL